MHGARAFSVSLSFPSSVRSYCLRPCVSSSSSSCFVAEYLIPGRCNSARPAIRGLPLLQSIVVTANEPSPFPVMQSDLFVARHTKIDYYIESFFSDKSFFSSSSATGLSPSVCVSPSSPHFVTENLIPVLCKHAYRKSAFTISRNASRSFRRTRTPK